MIVNEVREGFLEGKFAHGSKKTTRQLVERALEGKNQGFGRAGHGRGQCDQVGVINEAKLRKTTKRGTRQG